VYEEYSKGEIEQAINELVKDGELILNTMNYYEGSPELVQQYQFYEEHMHEYLNELSDEEEIEEPVIRKSQNIIEIAESWVSLQTPNITYSNDHCFLEGHYLDNFIVIRNKC
jgi:hypothetical protein